MSITINCNTLVVRPVIPKLLKVPEEESFKDRVAETREANGNCVWARTRFITSVPHKFVFISQHFSHFSCYEVIHIMTRRFLLVLMDSMKSLWTWCGLFNPSYGPVSRLLHSSYIRHTFCKDFRGILGPHAIGVYILEIMVH